MDEEQAKQILGITEADNARTAKIKFRRLIGRYHPDAAGEDSLSVQEQAQRINAAYTFLKSKDFFLEREEEILLWNAPVNEKVFISRNIYSPYHMGIETDGLYQTFTRGKYMWNPDEEEFPLFLRSILLACKELLDKVEIRFGMDGRTDDWRIPYQVKLFHCLVMQFVDPLYCLDKIAKPEANDQEGRRIYCFRAYLGEKQDRDRMNRILSLHKGDPIYPAALHGWKLMAADPQGNYLGYLSFAEDELYYCLFPLMRARLVQIKMSVVRVRSNKGNYLRQIKAEIAFRIRLKEGSDRYQNPDGNMEIQQILDEYKRELAAQRR